MSVNIARLIVYVKCAQNETMPLVLGNKPIPCYNKIVVAP